MATSDAAAPDAWQPPVVEAPVAESETAALPDEEAPAATDRLRRNFTA
jgi:hypothetical protein